MPSIVFLKYLKIRSSRSSFCVDILPPELWISLAPPELPWDFGLQGNFACNDLSPTVIYLLMSVSEYPQHMFSYIHRKTVEKRVVFI